MIKCLFLVEGPYDLQRLSLLKSLFDENKLEIFPLEGDKLTATNYSTEFLDIIKEYLDKDSTHSIDEFDFFAQICDTDGCFIDASLVIKNDSIKRIVYHRNHIDVVDVTSKTANDEIKRNNINELLASGKIELFYNSCNIDDAYDGLLNPSKKQKARCAINMYDRYKNDLCSFIDFIFGIDNSNSKTYIESWDYIKQGTNSLSKTSNLKYFLINHLSDLKDEYKKIISEKYL